MKVNVHVTPKAKRNSVKQLDETHYKVWVTAAAEKGKANAAAIKLLAKHLDIAPSLLTVVSGAASRNKIIEIDWQSLSDEIRGFFEKNPVVN